MKAVVFFLVIVLAIAFYNLLSLTPAQSQPLTIAIQTTPVASTHQVTGAPTMSATMIDHVLAVAHSPALETGAVFYRFGVQYGINPAYAVAFFHHESSYGLAGVATHTLSIGNIRCTAGYSCSGGFRLYISYAAGIEDWYRLIRAVYVAHGLDTVEKIIPVYAPASDHNDVAAYIASVVNDVTRWQKGMV